MDKITLKHVFVGIIVVFCICFLNMCNSCSTKKNVSKIKIELSASQDSIDSLSNVVDAQMKEIQALRAYQVAGQEVMQLYLNTAVNSPRTLEQIQKDSVLTKIMKK